MKWQVFKIYALPVVIFLSLSVFMVIAAHVSTQKMGTNSILLYDSTGSIYVATQDKGDKYTLTRLNVIELDSSWRSIHYK